MTGRRDRERDRDRDEKKGSSKQQSSSAANAGGGRQTQFFINGDGIDREVITTDICRYLGNDALVRPGVHKESRTGQETHGYYITAYRAPTSAQLADLRADSQKWQEERRKNRPGGQYSNSSIRREIWQEPEDPPAQTGYPSTPYGMQPPPLQNPQPRPTYENPGRTGGYPPVNPQMPQTGPPGGYRDPVPYAQNPGSHYTYRPQEQTTLAYGVQQGAPSIPDSSRGGMEPSALRPMQPGPPYSPPTVGMPTAPPGYGRGAGYAYPGQQQPMQPGYGQTQDYQPYGPRDSGAPPETTENYYDNDDNEMDYEDSPAPASAVPQPRPREGQRERDRDREHEPNRKHRHR